VELDRGEVPEVLDVERDETQGRRPSVRSASASRPP
jgi:hypothetical protein